MRPGSIVFWGAGALLAASSLVGLLLLGFSDAPSLHGVVRFGASGYLALALGLTARDSKANMAAGRWGALMAPFIGLALVATVFSVLPEHHTLWVLHDDVLNALNDCPAGYERLDLNLSTLEIVAAVAVLVPAWAVAAYRSTTAETATERWSATAIAVLPVVTEFVVRVFDGAQAGAAVSALSAAWAVWALQRARSERLAHATEALAA